METALGSFDFLNGSDADEEEDGAGRKSRNGRSVFKIGISFWLLCLTYPEFIFYNLKSILENTNMPDFQIRKIVCKFLIITDHTVRNAPT